MKVGRRVLARRKDLRLKGYDYSRAAAYFLTLCTQDRACLFGEVTEGQVRPSDAGEMIQGVWAAIPAFHVGVVTDAFVVMPNHIHGILLLDGTNGLELSELVGKFKSLTSKRYGEEVRPSGWPAFRDRLWQRGYFEHVIRGPESLLAIREYIAANPARWNQDVENPRRVHADGESSERR